MKAILEYVSDLKENNNRDWFLQTKPRYIKARDQFLIEIQSIIDDLQLKDQRLSHLRAKDSMFRIYRDVRFSNDKTPYKTHFSAYIAKGGKNSKQAGYYIQVGSDEFFFGAGVYSPEKEDLKLIRQEILYQPDTFTGILKEKENLGFILFEEDKLKNGPKDFPKDSPYSELLKYKHFLLSGNLNKKDVLSGNFAGLMTSKFEQLIPFTEFLNTAMEFKGNE